MRTNQEHKTMIHSTRGDGKVGRAVSALPQKAPMGGLI
jgi:hypothetical protein